MGFGAGQKAGRHLHPLPATARLEGGRRVMRETFFLINFLIKIKNKKAFGVLFIQQ